jgi:hypothetical protein
VPERIPNKAFFAFREGWRLSLGFTPRPLHPQGQRPGSCQIWWVGPRTILHAMKTNCLPQLGNPNMSMESSSPYPVYWLKYLMSFKTWHLITYSENFIYEIGKFNFCSTKSYDWTQPWSIPVQFTPSQPVSQTRTLILFLRLGTRFLKDLFQFGFLERKGNCCKVVPVFNYRCITS